MSHSSKHAAPKQASHKTIYIGLCLLLLLTAGGFIYYKLSSQGNEPNAARAIGTPPAVPKNETIPVNAIPANEPRLGNATQLVKGRKTDQSGNRLIIDSIGVNAPLDTVGTIAAGKLPEMAIPSDVNRVGWLKTSAQPSWVMGNSIISGHVSDTHDSPGALWNLKQTKVGDLIKWVQDGREWTYVITGFATYPRIGTLPNEMFDVTDHKYLYVVTCGDRQDLGGGHFTYRANLVVKARLYGLIDDPAME